MSEFVFPPPAAPSVAVADEDSRFPVRRILCVGRNYAAHRREMGGDDREPPFFFAKPADAVAAGGPIPFPPSTTNLHHEVELVIALAGGGVDLSVEDAMGTVFGYAVGVDLTRRDLQEKARAHGQPWEAAKGFDLSAPISAIKRWKARNPPAGAIRLRVNGAMRQDAHLDDMIWNVPEIIVEASKLWRLARGDLIFTGTPEGVGPLLRGDKVACDIEGIGALAFQIG